MSRFKKMDSIESQISDLQNRFKQKLNELKNLYKENKCYFDFVKDKKLIEEYEIWKDKYYHNRGWRR